MKHLTAVVNQIRGLLGEYGLVITQSPEKVRPALIRFLDDAESGLTAFARDTFSELYEQLRDLESRIERVTHRVERVYRAHPVCRKLAAVPGIGSLTAPDVSQRTASGGLVGSGASAIFQEARRS